MKLEAIGGGLRRVGRRWPWLVLLAVSLVLHLVALGERSYHHDESIHAHASWVLAQEGKYRYDPTYHGPLLYYLTAAVLLVHDSDQTARLPVALAGVALLAVAWSLRRPFGERAAWWTGLLVTISPLYLYYGRFLRMDVLEVLWASAAAVAAWRAARGRARCWVWAGVWVGLAAATKENCYVTAALVSLVWAVQAVVAGLHRAVPATLAWLRARSAGLIIAAAAATVVAIPLYTVAFTHPEDWFFPARAVAYWWGQHTVERVAGVPWYHLPRLALYEFLPIVAALVWAARRCRRMRRVETSLLVFGLASITMYAYLGEKVAWLGVHQVWAFLPLAGAQLARTFGPRGRWWSRTVAALAVVVTAAFSIAASFPNAEISPRRDRVEALVYVQTCPELLAVVDEGLELAEQGEDPAAAVPGDAGWPLTWYWRSTPVWWSEPQPGMRPPVVVCNLDQETELRTRLGPGYTSERLPLRAWWPPPGDAPPSLGELAAYVLARRPWSEIGSSDMIVLRRTGDEVQPVREARVPASLAQVLPVARAWVLGEGWLSEPRGVAVAANGTIAVADVGLSTVVLLGADGAVGSVDVADGLNQPEAVAWTPEGLLAVADTWGQRAVLIRRETRGVAPLPEPPDGWWGPRGIAVSASGDLAVADTGNKRIVVFSPGARRSTVIGEAGSEVGQLVEPGGLAWLDGDGMVVCDTGNHRLQVFDGAGAVVRVVDLGQSWADFYSRPQVAVISPDLWVVTDPPARGLIVVDGEGVRRIDLGADGISPAGVAWHDGTLYLTDLERKVWAFELEN